MIDDNDHDEDHEKHWHENDRHIENKHVKFIIAVYIEQIMMTFSFILTVLRGLEVYGMTILFTSSRDRRSSPHVKYQSSPTSRLNSGVFPHKLLLSQRWPGREFCKYASKWSRLSSRVPRQTQK